MNKVLAFIIIFALAIPNVFFNDDISVLGYSLYIDESVDADSDIDSVENVGTSEGDYTDAQSKDGTQQNITEVNNAVSHDFEDSHDAITDSQSPANIGTYSDDSAMNTKDSANNTLTEGVGDGFTIEENISDTFDSYTTDIDSYADIGTDASWSNAQAITNDGSYMTMQEANLGGAGGSEWLSVPSNGFDNTINEWDANVGADPWLDVQDQPTNVVHELSSAGKEIGWFNFSDTTIIGIGITINVSINAYNHDGSNNDGFDVYWDVSGGSGTFLAWYQPDSVSYKYITVEVPGTFSVTEVNAFRIYLDTHMKGQGDDVWVDYARIGVFQVAGDDYELDLEYQFTSVDFDNSYEYLCTYIQIATVNGDNLKAWEWTGSAWNSLGSLTSDAWNNFSISYLTSSIYYIKFNDSDQGYETTQSTFNMDAIFLRTSNNNNNDYEFDREFSFTNLNTTDLNEELVIYTGDILDIESLKVYVWSGTVWEEIATISTGQTNTWINISISSQLNSSTEYFSFRDTNQVLDSSQGIWEINYVAIHTWGVLPNYELQWEHQVQGIDPDKDSYNITIFGYDPPEYSTGEILELRGQSYRQWYNADTETFTYRSDYLVQKEDIHSETDWVTYDEYPIRFILRLNNGTIKTFESAIQITNYIGLIDNSTIWGVAIESFNGVLGFYLNFAENWGHGQMLYYPRLLDGTLSSYTQPLYAIYYHLYANYGGTWYDQLLNNKTLYDVQSNPRNNLRFSNTSDIFQIEFNTNNIDILSSNWNFTHGFKYNITEKRFHPINKVVCNNRDFDDIGFGYEITYTPMAETNYKLDRFILQNSTNFITVDVTTAWKARTYLDNYLAKVIIIAENGQTFNFYFDDMINAGFTNNYLEFHEIILPNGIVRKTLLAGMYGYGNYINGTWIEIDSIFSEKQFIDEYDFYGYHDYSSTYVVQTGSIELDMGESAEPRMYNSTLTFDLGITGYISTITNVNMTVYVVSASQLELDEYIGLALYFNSTLTGGFWNETYVTGKAETWTKQDYYWTNYSFIPGDLPSGNTTFTDADMRPILNQWLIHHNTDPSNRQYINFMFFPGTDTDVGTNDNMRIYDAQMGTESFRTTLTIEYEMYEPVMVEVWNNTDSVWDLASTTTSNITDTEQWYNYTISADYVDGSNQITWRYVGTSESGDSLQDTLYIDYAGVTAWNFTIDLLPTNIVNPSYLTGSGWELFDSAPFTINVTCGVTYNIEIMGVDGDGNPVTNEYLRFNTVDNPTTGTNLSTSYQELFIDQVAGDEVQLTFYLWSSAPFGLPDQQMTFTLYVRIIKSS